MMGRPFKCPYEGCGASENVSKGVRRTKSMGDRRIFRCKKCGRKFTPKHQQPAEAREEAPPHTEATPASATA
jgi:tRNA(Ile2) C34 agmatinyltransferase TiaS